MAVGLNVGKPDLDAAAGVILRNLQMAINRAVQMNQFLNTKQDADLVALGYTAADISMIRGAFQDVLQLAAIYTGQATLAVAKDFRTNARQVWGMGDVS